MELLIYEDADLYKFLYCTVNETGNNVIVNITLYTK